MTVRPEELRQVLELVAEGLRNKQIAARLGPGFSEDMVKSRIRILFAKLGAVDRANLVHIGHKKGWLS